MCVCVCRSDIYKNLHYALAKMLKTVSLFVLPFCCIFFFFFVCGFLTSVLIFREFSEIAKAELKLDRFERRNWEQPQHELSTAEAIDCGCQRGNRICQCPRHAHWQSIAPK